MQVSAVFSTLQRVGPSLRAVSDALRHRGQLAALEAAEARDHLTHTALLGGGAAALVLLGGFAVNVAIAAAVWHLPQRGLILALLALAYLGGGAWLANAALRRLRSWDPLHETRRQLGEDAACVHSLFDEDRHHGSAAGAHGAPAAGGGPASYVNGHYTGPTAGGARGAYATASNPAPATAAGVAPTIRPARPAGSSAFSAHSS